MPFSTTSDAQSPTTPPSTTQSPQRSPQPDLRRLTSNPGLAAAAPSHPRGLSPRSSQHLGSVRGTLSPAASIPSSPTSIHSSSSAIFERDVEPILSLSGASTSPGHNPNPHLVPRGKGSEALDQSVPSVLDSAVEVLASSPSGDIDALADVAVLAPASSGLAQSLSAILTPSAGSPVRSRGTSPMRSRSPSPLQRLSGAPSSLEQSLLGASISSSISPTRPTIDTQATLTQVPRLNGASNNTDASSTSSSPTTTTLERAPALPTPTPAATFNIQGSANPNVAIPRPSPPRSPGAADRLGAPPSPSRASKRLSFLSYADLLSSTPASTVPLAALTSSAGTEPPPHLPSVLGLAAAAQDGRHAGSSASSVHGVPLGNSPIGTGHGHGFGASGHAARGQRESVLLVPGEEAGGEWEREGLGMGLEERMEVLLSSPVASPVAGKA